MYPFLYQPLGESSGRAKEVARSTASTMPSPLPTRFNHMSPHHTACTRFKRLHPDGSGVCVLALVGQPHGLRRLPAGGSDPDHGLAREIQRLCAGTRHLDTPRPDRVRWRGECVWLHAVEAVCRCGPDGAGAELWVVWGRGQQAIKHAGSACNVAILELRRQYEQRGSMLIVLHLERAR